MGEGEGLFATCDCRWAQLDPASVLQAYRAQPNRRDVTTERIAGDTRDGNAEFDDGDTARKQVRARR